MPTLLVLPAWGYWVAHLLAAPDEGTAAWPDAQIGLTRYFVTARAPTIALT